ncbi:DNA methyltransferase [Shewanella khirikhana]|uniref:DNA methyltransferase n=1 Tax=Shewanella khirikhana TaxID=1965282 RepID=UPI0030D4B959
MAENALNAVCPYFTMFPLEYPTKILNRFKSDSPVVIDPFCGRGTTLFAARKFGFDAWGVDSSLVAVAIARAKLASCESKHVIELAQELLSQADDTPIPTSDFFTCAYDKETLLQICKIRNGLLNLEVETDSSVILRAVCLGALHGPRTKSIDTASYFSNQMPRTFSSKPDYSVRYWRERDMQPPKIDVLSVIRKRTLRLSGLSDKVSGTFHQVLNGDSRLAESFASARKDFTTVITSPPYYGMRTYVQDQWLRNWFLGGSDFVDYSVVRQLEHGGQVPFAESLGKVWNNMALSTSDQLRMFVRFGIIPSAKVDAKKLFLESLESSDANWKVVSVRNAKTAHEGKRQAGQMKSNSTASSEFDFHIVRI